LKWIEWTQKLQAIAQNGLTYSKDKFDIERYKQLQAIVAEIISTYTNHDFHEVQNYLNKETGYATPKIDVRGVAFKNDKILMVKENADNLWTLPGGWADILETPSENVEREVFEESGYKVADILETPSENVEREVFEESGYKVKAKRLLAVYDRSRHGHYPEYPNYVYKMFFLCEIIGGESRTSMETSGVDFFGLHELPEISVARVTKKQIHRMFELKEKNQTDFD
jgi:ADP-ribose pyrophosphatase YjhB (NUDIX family)